MLGKRSDRQMAWKVVSSRCLSDNRFSPLYEDVCITPGGQRVIYYKFVGSSDTVIVVPFTREGRLVLVRLYRHGAQRVFIEPPAGMREKGEDVRKTALRELLEETGYKAAKLALLQEGYYDPSRSKGKMYVFAALDCVKVSEQNLDKSEDIEVVLASPKRFLNKSLKDKGANSRVAGALVMARLRYPKLFAV